MYSEHGIMGRVLDEVPKVNTPVEAKGILLEAYDIATGIFDHVGDEAQWASQALDKRNPYTLDGYHYALSFGGQARRKDRLESFMKKGVYAKLGITFLEFIELPREIMEEIIEQCDAFSAEESKRADDLFRELNEMREKMRQSRETDPPLTNKKQR